MAFDLRRLLALLIVVAGVAALHAAAQTTAITRTFGFSSAIARIAPSIAAPPAMSSFILTFMVVDSFAFRPLLLILGSRRGSGHNESAGTAP